MVERLDSAGLPANKTHLFSRFSPKAAKRELLDAVKDFKSELSKSGGDLSIDFGVKGGELDKKDRAPKNLAAAGVFRAVSGDLGDAADRVLELADLLARYTPNKEPLKHFGTSLGSKCALHGAWSLLFTTAADATFTKNSTRGAAKVCNVVDAVAGTVTNCIDFEETSALESLRVRLTARPASPRRLDLAFRSPEASYGRRYSPPTLHIISYHAFYHAFFPSPSAWKLRIYTCPSEKLLRHPAGRPATNADAAGTWSIPDTSLIFLYQAGLVFITGLSLQVRSEGFGLRVCCLQEAAATTVLRSPVLG